MKPIASDSFIRHLSMAILIAGAVLSAPLQAQQVAGLPQVKPESVGFSSERLKRVNDAMQRLVDEKQVAGLVTLTARHGKVLQSGAYGMRDIESGARMTQDAIFRIYSMTKPVTGVAMMILYEEGKWNPQDPISKHIPEFADLKVFKAQDRQGNLILEDLSYKPTMQELMAHTAGFSYGSGNHPVDELYKDGQDRKAVLKSSSLQEMIDRLAKIPLAYQPGTRWVYSVSVDIQGYLVEKLSGQPFAVFMKERIFDPLGMDDTAFHVPPEKLSRFATLYRRNDQDLLEPVPPEESLFDSKRAFLDEPSLPSGGGGLVSTAGDYLKFAQMLLNGGELNRVRILSPATVKMMTANHLPQTLMNPAMGQDGNIRPGVGFGFDFAVFTDPGLAANPSGVGSYYWGGAAGTWFWIDPANDLAFVGMVQLLSSPPNTWTLRELTQQTLYQALLDPKK